MIYVIAELRIRSEMAEKAFAVARKTVAATIKEDGCITYDMHQSVSDASRLVVVERWASRDALSRHFETPHLKAWRAAGAEFIVDRNVDVVTPRRSTSSDPPMKTRGQKASLLTATHVRYWR